MELFFLCGLTLFILFVSFLLLTLFSSTGNPCLAPGRTGLTFWDGREQVSVFPLAKNYTFSVASKVFLSIDEPEHVARLGHHFHVLTSGIVPIQIDLPGTRFNRAIKASILIRQELGVIIKQRKVDLAEKYASPTQDILSPMLLTCDENGMYMNELEVVNIAVHSNVYIFEQIEIAKSKAPAELLNWEDIHKMKYSWNVACEVMRLAPPLQGGFREALNQFIYAGFTIPKARKLYLNANSIHRNPKCFLGPEKFDPLRFEGKRPTPYTYVPFGGGPRMCPGKEYARLEILLFMHNIIKRYKWEKLDPNENIIVDPFSMPAKGLPIRLFPKTRC